MTDLQSDIAVGEDGISGTLKYIADYSAAYGPGEDSGYYLALHVGSNVEDVTYTMQVLGGKHGPTTLDSDKTNICRITSTTQKIRVTASKAGYKTVTKDYYLNGIQFA